MAKRTRELTETFLAVDDAGQKHTIKVFTDMITSSRLDGSIERNTGMQSYKMGNGNPVNVAQDGTLIDVRTGRRMHRV